MTRPTVSIVLPTYNRAAFLPQALASIRSQTFTDWELVVVDDGSTDDTARLVRDLAQGWSQPVRYHRQENQGAYGARNTGLDLADGEFIAFFDSDDVWLPHHLADCVAGLAADPQVDWVYGACRVVDYLTGRTISPSTFYVDGRPREFLRLRTRGVGPLTVVEDPGVLRTMVSHGLYCGLQNSVIRRRVFAGRRFRTAYRNEAEDLLIVIRALAAGHRIGYLDNVHVVYHVHAANSSAAGNSGSVDKRAAVFEGLLRGFDDIRSEVAFTPAEGRALKRSVSRVWFWDFGYTILWQNGRRREAVRAFRHGLRLWPWDLRCWKTFLFAWVRILTAERTACRAGRH